MHDPFHAEGGPLLELASGQLRRGGRDGRVPVLLTSLLYTKSYDRMKSIDHLSN